MPERFYPLMEYYHSKIKHLILPVKQQNGGIFLDMKTDFSYTSIENILNGLLLPLASTLADNIYLLGFDGRTPDDEIFWKNSENNSYTDLKRTIISAHPAFFNKIDYDLYAKWQSDGAELLMSLGESKGKKYYCMNKTTIPALIKRPAIQERTILYE
jgi:hypothetical protein